MANIDDDLVFYIPFNIISGILRQWKVDNEMKGPTVMS